MFSKPRYPTYASMPTWLLVLLAALSAPVCLFTVSVLVRVLPRYVDAVTSTPLAGWGMQGWLASFYLLALAAMIGWFGLMAWRCLVQLRSRARFAGQRPSN